MLELADDGLLLEIELGTDAPETVENADGWVTLADGTRWSATFLTYSELGRIMDRWRGTGECLGGSYFTCPDLVLTRSPGVAIMFAAVKDLVDNGELGLALQRVE